MSHDTTTWNRRWSGTLLILISLSASLTTGAAGVNGAQPCSINLDVRQLDYWLGQWTITNSGDAGRGTSNVHLSLDRCLFAESWNNGSGHSGENLLAYSVDDKNWYGLFADNEGRAHIFGDGKVSGGSAEFHGRSRGPNGETVLNRIKVVRLAPDRVEQTWEQSADSGATWKTVYRGEYARATR